MGIRMGLDFLVECDSRKAGDDCWQYYAPDRGASVEGVIKQALAEGWKSTDGLWICPNCVQAEKDDAAAQAQVEPATGAPRVL